jgi:2-oxoglutarate dehydrogenase E1 component
MRVANCTTPAQYFHLLRRQALNPVRRPLIVMTPKSLLRHPAAVSAIDAFTNGIFRPIIDDDGVDPDRVRRVALCSGKLYYDLAGADTDDLRDRNNTAIVRVEQLYPFPRDELSAVLERYDGAEIVWVQEEPRNMGAWSWFDATARRELGLTIRYIGRPDRASPAEGYAVDHERQQNRIIDETLSAVPAGETRKERPAKSRRGGK